MDDNYYDAEKHYHESISEGRRSFIKKIGAVVAGAVALDRAAPKVPDPPSPVPLPLPEPPHIRSMGVDFNNGDYDVVYSSMTASAPRMYTTIPSYAWDSDAWFPIEEKPPHMDMRERADEYWRKKNAVHKKG